MSPTGLAVLGATLAAASGSGLPADSLRRFEFAEPHLGTTFRVAFFAPDSASAAAGAVAAFDVIRDLDRRFSDYDPESEVSRLAEVAGRDGGRAVSGELADILAIARGWSERTDGAFDVTVGPLTRLWRWSARRGELPDSDRLARARAAVGWRRLEVDPATRVVRLTRRGMAIDLGGIAKGYAADAALAELARLGLRSALVEAGGDMALGDPPPGRRGWRVAVEAVGRTVVLANAGVATSGDRFRYFEAGGVRYSHIVDPRTGLGVTRPRTVTGIARDATTADAVASALTVLDDAAGRTLVGSVPGARTLEIDGPDTPRMEPER